MRRVVCAPRFPMTITRPSHKTGCKFSRGTQKVAHERLANRILHPVLTFDVEKTCVSYRLYISPSTWNAERTFEKARYDYGLHKNVKL